MINKKESFVIISGGFDPIHIGHIELIEKASRYGKVIAILNSDGFLMKKKGFIFMPLEERSKILESIKDIHQVFISIDKDLTVKKSIQSLHSKYGSRLKYFANGGDRKSTNDIPESEICSHCNIEMIFGLGKKIQSSSKLAKESFITIEKPWGEYKNFYEESECLVKKIEVLKGESLSLQTHKFRDEHWIVISGKGKLILGDKQYELNKNDHFFIPRKVKHRLINDGEKELNIVEVQVGDKFLEEDIIRYEDKYHRD